MSDNLLQEAISVGTRAVDELCSGDLSFQPFHNAVKIIHEAYSDSVDLVRIYTFRADNGILYEEAMSGFDEGQGEDQRYLSQIIPEFVKEGAVDRRQMGSQHEALVPLRVRGKLVGALAAAVVTGEKPGLPTETLKTLSDVLSAGVYSQLERRTGSHLADFFRSAVMMGRELAGVSGGNSDRLLYHHVSLIVEKLGFDRATLFMFDEEGKDIERGICAVGGQPPFEMENLEAARIPVMNDQPILIQEFPGVWVPIGIGANRRLGALLADNLFSLAVPPDEVVQVLVDVSGQVALAMKNAQLLERLQEMALRDELTGLFRPGYFNERIQEELAKMEREQSSAGLLFIDLDDFKGVNDAYGHQAGDAVLSQVADVIRSSVRISDVACRMGGDEFTVLLPGISYEATRLLASRFCRRIAEHHFLLPQGGTIQLTASVGVASFPEDASSWQQLVRRADEAMYLEKQARKESAAHS